MQISGFAELAPQAPFADPEQVARWVAQARGLLAAGAAPRTVASSLLAPPPRRAAQLAGEDPRQAAHAVRLHWGMNA